MSFGSTKFHSFCAYSSFTKSDPLRMLEETLTFAVRCDPLPLSLPFPSASTLNPVAVSVTKTISKLASLRMSMIRLTAVYAKDCLRSARALTICAEYLSDETRTRHSEATDVKMDEQSAMANLEGLFRVDHLVDPDGLH